MALIFTRLTDAYGFDGVTPVEQNWKVTDDFTGTFISKSYPIATTEATIKADLTALFPANPTPRQESMEAMKVLRVGDSYMILDPSGKPLLSMKRETDGGVDIKGYDDLGNAASYSRTQRLTLDFKGNKTASAVFPVPFKKVPSVTITLLDSSAQPPYKSSVTKEKVVVKFQNAYNGRVEINIGE